MEAHTFRSLTWLKKKDINGLHAELGHPLGDIIWVTAWAIWYHSNGMFKPFEDHALGKGKKMGVSKEELACSKGWE